MYLQNPMNRYGNPNQSSPTPLNTQLGSDWNQYAEGGLVPNNPTDPSSFNPSHGAMRGAWGFNSPAQYARGGHPKRKNKMMLAHFNRHELEALDRFQDGIVRNDKGVKCYPGIEAVLKNPHVFELINSKVFEHRAAGGPVPPADGFAAGGPVPPADGFSEGGSVLGDARNMVRGISGGFAGGGMVGDPLQSYLQGPGHAPVRASDGMNGDTELAYIGPSTRRLFDMHAHNAINPIDGAPQYFSLDSILGGLGGAFKSIAGVPGSIGGGLMKQFAPIASQLLPTLGQMAGTAIGGEAGMPGMGSMLGGMLGNMGSQMLNPSGQAPTGYGANVANGLGAAMNSYQQGGGLQGMLGSGMAGMGQGMNNPFGAGLQTFGNNYAQGGNFRNAASNAVQAGASMSNQPWAGALGAAANAYGQGGGLGQMGGAAMQNYGQQRGGALGGALSGMGGALSSGGGLGQMARGGYQGGMNAMQQEQLQQQQQMEEMQQMQQQMQQMQQMPQQGYRQQMQQMPQQGYGQYFQPASMYPQQEEEEYYQ